MKHIKLFEDFKVRQDIVIDGKKVDVNSITIEGVDKADHPDYSDAYAATANFEDGTELNAEQIQELDSEHGDVIHELIHNRR